jgi:predicted neuraminidase
MLLPLYSDGYSFGLIALSDDHGETWQASEPIIGGGGVQPSVVRRKSGELVAYLRDNGPPPKRMLVSTSKDDGKSWTFAEDTEIPNPGSSVEAIALKDGRWILVYNDTERGRNSLAVSMSDDEGKTWKWTRHIEKAESGAYHYPSVIQSRDGAIHVTYSRYTGSKPEMQSIQHVRFNEAWIEGAGTAR